MWTCLKSKIGFRWNDIVSTINKGIALKANILLFHSFPPVLTILPNLLELFNISRGIYCYRKVFLRYCWGEKKFLRIELRAILLKIKTMMSTSRLILVILSRQYDTFAFLNGISLVSQQLVHPLSTRKKSHSGKVGKTIFRQVM